MTFQYPPPPPYGQPNGPQFGAPMMPPPPNNFLAPAIVATILCCLPFGIAGIVFAAQVNGKYYLGDFVGAQESARKARLYTWISVGVGAAWVVVVIAMTVFGLILADTSGTSSSGGGV